MAGSSKAAEKTILMIAVNALKEDPKLCSKSSEAAIAWTLDKIIRGNGSGFHVIFVHVQVPKRGFFGRLLPNDDSGRYKLLIADKSPEPAELESGGRGHGLVFLNGYEERFTRERILYEVCPKFGDPKKEICKAVKEFEPDLLVVGNSGLSAFQSCFRASVFKYCAKYADCPVIRIKPRAERKQARAERKQARAGPGPLINDMWFLSEKPSLE